MPNLLTGHTFLFRGLFISSSLFGFGVPSIAAKSNPCPFEQVAQACKLVIRQGIHWIDDDGLNAWLRVLETMVNDGNEKGFCLAATRSCGNQGVLGLMIMQGGQTFDCFLLMIVYTTLARL